MKLYQGRRRRETTVSNPFENLNPQIQMENTAQGNPSNHFYNPNIVKENDRKSVPRTNFQPYLRKYRVRELPNLKSTEEGEKNLRIYTGKVATEELSDESLALYTRLAAQREKCRRYPGIQFFGACPPEGKCLICSLDEHTSWDCPYAVEIPSKNAIVSGADIVCKVCDSLFSGGHCCKQVLGRARLKFCSYCRNFGEHCKQQCPHHLPDPQRRLSIEQ